MDKDLFGDILKFDFMLTSSKAALPDFIKPIETKEFVNAAKEYVYNEKWLEANLPQALGLSSRNLHNQISYGLFKYDVPHGTERKEKGIVFTKGRRKLLCGIFPLSEHDSVFDEFFALKLLKFI